MSPIRDFFKVLNRDILGHLMPVKSVRLRCTICSIKNWTCLIQDGDFHPEV